MHDSPSGSYYSAYVSAGGTACGTVHYSDWACENSSCYSSNNPGKNFKSRCCK